MAFHVLAVLNAVLAVALWRSIPESLPEERRHRGRCGPPARHSSHLVRDRVFLGYALTVGFAYASLFGYISGSSRRATGALRREDHRVERPVRAQRGGHGGPRPGQRAAGPPFAVRRLLIVGLTASSVAAVVLVLGVTASTASACSRCWCRCSW